MGSNSSTIQQDTVNNIQTNLVAEGVVSQDTTCITSNITFTGTCPPPTIVNSCYTGSNVTSDLVISQTVQTTQAALTQQSSQNGMFRFLNWNDQTTSETIENYINTQLSNKCLISQTTSAIVTNITVLITKRPCLRSLKIYNINDTESQCTLTTSMNIYSDADMNATTTQKSGGIGGNGSCQDAGCAQAFIILAVVFLFIGIIVLFFFRHKNRVRSMSGNQGDNLSEPGGEGPSHHGSSTSVPSISEMAQDYQKYKGLITLMT